MAELNNTKVSKKIVFKKDIFYEEISLKTFTWFCYRFNLYPEIIHPTDSILIFRSLTAKKQALDLDKDDPQKLITKAGGAIERGMDFADFKEGLLRISIKGKKIFNLFAQKLQDASINRSQLQDQIASNNQANQSSVSQGGVKSEDPNADSNGGIRDFIAKNKQLVDEYGKIEECNAGTLTVLLYYLGFPKEK